MQLPSAVLGILSVVAVIAAPRLKDTSPVSTLERSPRLSNQQQRWPVSSNRQCNPSAVWESQHFHSCIMPQSTALPLFPKNKG